MTVRLLSTNLTQTINPVYINRVKQMQHMDHYLNEQQVEELVNFDYVEQDLANLIDDEQKFDINDYLNSNIDY